MKNHTSYGEVMSNKVRMCFSTTLIMGTGHLIFQHIVTVVEERWSPELQLVMPLMAALVTLYWVLQIQKGDYSSVAWHADPAAGLCPLQASG